MPCSWLAILCALSFPVLCRVLQEFCRQCNRQFAALLSIVKWLLRGARIVQFSGQFKADAIWFFGFVFFWGRDKHNVQLATC